MREHNMDFKILLMFCLILWSNTYTQTCQSLSRCCVKRRADLYTCNSCACIKIKKRWDSEWTQATMMRLRLTSPKTRVIETDVKAEVFVLDNRIFQQFPCAPYLTIRYGKMKRVCDSDTTTLKTLTPRTTLKTWKTLTPRTTLSNRKTLTPRTTPRTWATLITRKTLPPRTTLSTRKTLTPRTTLSTRKTLAPRKIPVTRATLITWTTLTTQKTLITWKTLTPKKNSATTLKPGHVPVTTKKTPAAQTPEPVLTITLTVGGGTCSITIIIIITLIRKKICCAKCLRHGVSYRSMDQTTSEIGMVSLTPNIAYDVESLNLSVTDSTENLCQAPSPVQTRSKMKKLAIE